MILLAYITRGTPFVKVILVGVHHLRAVVVNL